MEAYGVGKQHSPYHVHDRERVCHQYFSLGMTMTAISDLYGGHPCRQTVSTIVHDYLEKGVVVGLNGRNGLKTSTRKFNDEAWEALVSIVTEDEAFILSGTCSSLAPERQPMLMR